MNEETQQKEEGDNKKAERNKEEEHRLFFCLGEEMLRKVKQSGPFCS